MFITTTKTTVVGALFVALFASVFLPSQAEADNKALIPTYRYIEPDVQGRDPKIQIGFGKPTVVWKQFGQAFYPMEYGTDRILIFYQTKNFDWPDEQRLPENGGFHGVPSLQQGFQIPANYKKGFHLVFAKDKDEGPRIVLRWPAYVQR